MLKDLLILVVLVQICVGSGVVDLGNTNYTEYLSNNNLVLLEIYAPWCGHCQSLAPQYEKLPELLKEDGVAVARINGDEETEAATYYPYKGYPTVLFVYNANKIEYSGLRNAESITLWVKKILSTKLTKISESEIGSKQSNQTFVIVQSNNQSILEIVRVASIVGELEYYHVESNNDQIILYSEKKGKVVYKGELNTEQLVHWVHGALLPTLLPLNEKQYTDELFRDKTKQTIILVRQSPLDRISLQILQEFCDKDDNIKCGVVEKTDQIFKNVKEYFQIKDQVNKLTYLTEGLMQGYVSSFDATTLTKQQIEEWIEGIKSGALKPDVKQPDPVAYTKLIQLTEENFTQYIQQHPYTFIQFYYPTCSVCMKMAEEFQEFAVTYNEKQDKVKVVVIDGSTQSNITNQQQIYGSPVFRFYLNGVYIEYKGNKTISQIQEWIQFVLSAKLKDISSIQQITKPSVVIYDSSNQSVLESLSARIHKVPVYQLQQGNQIKIQYHSSQGVDVYPGDIKNITSITQWAALMGLPVLVELGTRSEEDNRLSVAIGRNIPFFMLVLIIQTDVEKLSNILKTHCKGKHQTFICGTLKKQQPLFDSIIEWVNINIENKQTNFLVYTQTQTKNNYLYDKDLSQLNPQSLDDFVKRVEKGEVPKIQEKNKESTQGQQSGDTTNQGEENNQSTSQGQQTNQPTIDQTSDENVDGNQHKGDHHTHDHQHQHQHQHTQQNQDKGEL